MAKWIKCLTTIICLGIVAYSGHAKELTLADVFPTDRVLDIQITFRRRIGIKFGSNLGILLKC